MKVSQFLIPTQKEAPNDAQLISHQLMVRAGFISKLASGLYTYLPLGLMVVRKIEAIIREEMNKTGAQELLMPIVQPAELWQKTGRLEEYGTELLRFKDRHRRDFCLGPTHEEVITELVAQYVNSYKQLPMTLYQIQTKFRDEIRPRFGVMRAREFVMKDAYSFHLDMACLQKTYQIMYQTYCNIFDRLGLNYRAVLADPGAIGGDSSHEFHVLADSGEDAIAFCERSDYGANIEQVALPEQLRENEVQKKLTRVDTPDCRTISEVVQLLAVDIKKTVKTLIIEDSTGYLFAVVLRGDHSLNEVKLGKLPPINAPIKMASDARIKQVLNIDVGFIGVVGLKNKSSPHQPIDILVDYSAAALANFVCGANSNHAHYINVNWQRDVKSDFQPTFKTVDIRNVVEGDDSPDGCGKLTIKRGIEVGHIFQLGQKYSQAFNANVIGKSGRGQTLIMGCYGIGVTRLFAAIIEQNYDEWGIIFPPSVSPAKLIIVPINYHKSHRVKAQADELYTQCVQAGLDVILDDRKERAGVLFAQSELLGIAHRIVISDGLLDKNFLEYKARNLKDKELINLEKALTIIQKKIA